jgi:hypothetical protein
MLDFLRILFFAKTILLTPQPVTLLGEMELRPHEPLSAVTSGAGIEIDVSSMLTRREGEGIVELRRRVTDVFPPRAIEARLQGKGVEVVLRYDGGVAVADDAIVLGLAAAEGVPVETEFDRVMLKTAVKLDSVRVSWRNAKH